MAAVMERVARHRDGWLGAEFDWGFMPAHLAAIDELMEKLANDPRPFHEITRRDFSHPALDADLAAVLAEIKNGPGILVIRGFPVGKYDAETMQTIYWGIGTHFGGGCSQSADGDYLGHVTNVEKARAATPPPANSRCTLIPPRSSACSACATPRRAASASTPAR
jgi:hypothetical protein